MVRTDRSEDDADPPAAGGGTDAGPVGGVSGPGSGSGAGSVAGSGSASGPGSGNGAGDGRTAGLVAGLPLVAGDGLARIGVAVDIPEPWGSLLTRRRAEAGDPLAAYVPAHLTLLGPTEIPPDRLPDVERHLAGVASAHRPYTLHLRGTGTFRPVTEVVFVVVAAGISETELLAAAIGAEPTLRRETRFPYHPHVTVAQDVPPESLDAVYEDLATFSARFEITGFTLFAHGGNGRWRPYRDFFLGDGTRPSGDPT